MSGTLWIPLKLTPALTLLQTTLKHALTQKAEVVLVEEGQSACLSGQLVLRNQGLRGLIVFGDEILSAADEADVCPFCGAEPLSCSPAKEITLYTQYRREIVYGKIRSLRFLYHSVIFQ